MLRTIAATSLPRRCCVRAAWRRDGVSGHVLRCAVAAVTHNNDDNEASTVSTLTSHASSHQQQPQPNGATTHTTTTTTTIVTDAYEVTTRCNAQGEPVSYTIRSPPSSSTAHTARRGASVSCSHDNDDVAAHASSDDSGSNRATAAHDAAAAARHDGGHDATRPAAATATATPHVVFSEPIKRIILIRNGLSEADVDVRAYVTTPDWRIPLVEAGRQQCMDTGRALADLVGDEPLYFYYSPYIRARQSLRYVLQGYDERGAQLQQQQQQQQQQSHDDSRRNVDDTLALQHDADASSSSSSVAARAPLSLASDASQLVLRPDTFRRIVGVREDVRLRDADVGRYSSTDDLLHHMRERERYGLFFYRFPHGESGADVCDRVTGFLDAFQRERLALPMNVNVVLLTHGLTIRMFVTRWFHLTVDTFHAMRSPPPASMCVLTRLHRQSRFRLDETSFHVLRLPASLNACNGYGYRNKQLLGSMSIGAPYM